MTTVTLSAKMHQVAFYRNAIYPLPATSTAFSKFQHLYQYTTYIRVDSEYATADHPICNYIPLHYIREESAIIVASEGPSIIILCKLPNQEEYIQFTKAYFMSLVNKGLVHTDVNIIRVEKISW